MKSYIVLVILSLSVKNVVRGASFPKYFKFGVATSSYQVEGGWNASGKGESIWDRLMHQDPNFTDDHKNGDVACDSYHLWETDVEMVKDLQMDFYRFSLSWPRILPTGFTNYVNPDGVRYYNDIINKLLKNNIEPMVTIFHWDLPQPLQELGGWTNPILVKHFENYAKTVFELFGDRVKTWITFNEPASVCEAGYGDPELAPLVDSPGIGDYLCGKTLLLSHAAAFHAYGKYFRQKQKGKIGFTINTSWMEPKDNRSSTLKAAERSLQFQFGWWAHPIYSKTGDYPEVMKSRIAYISKQQNFSSSRLPPLSFIEVRKIRGTYDFLGLNHYTTYLVGDKNTPADSAPSMLNDVSVTVEQDPAWETSAVDWLRVVPWGFRKILNWIKAEYNNPIVYVTESGYADKGGLNDTERTGYLRSYLNALLQAVTVDNCKVKAYTVWSLMDNFEWKNSYTVKFGLYEVDFNSPNRTRTAKASAKFFTSVVKTRNISKN